ncbi:PAS domain-containing protein [Croceivirga sp. JEA036]|uniref:PAS domain-containing protein n=1 Tax=Croceivirga sp. JEA036 TaxID=2721162 RepID=UPI00143A56EC|nr:PAS domain-containing protein [Croceivirga sp. JEA036]NJB36964.1 PAS domain-containing protein [Croceivirga sp. JEA036]
MKEFKYYDEAAKKFYNSVKGAGLPLCSWDQFSLGYSSITNKLLDVQQLQVLAKQRLWTSKIDFKQELLDKDRVIVVTKPDLTIVHASSNMPQMNGYLVSEVKGRTPKMFQGAKTNPEINRQIRNAIQAEQPFEAVVVNYRKNGAPYNCWIKGLPVWNTEGHLVNFIALEKEVA